jgi:hypothetical protein
MAGIYKVRLGDGLIHHDTDVLTKFNKDWFRLSKVAGEEDSQAHIQQEGCISLPLESSL